MYFRRLNLIDRDFTETRTLKGIKANNQKLTELSLRHRQTKPQDYIEIFDPGFEELVRLRRLTELGKPEDLTTHDVTFLLVPLFCFS